MSVLTDDDIDFSGSVRQLSQLATHANRTNLLNTYYVTPVICHAL